MLVMICGSRSATQDMLQFASRCVKRAKDRGFSIIVGDAPGVDAHVIELCDQLGVPVQVIGGYNRLRHQTEQGVNLTLPYNYKLRDNYMLDRADIVIGIWNTTSYGTLRNIESAKKIGLPNKLYSAKQPL